MNFTPFKKAHSNSRAFTLMEILVVLAIMVVLMGIGFSSFKGAGGQEFTKGISEVSGTLELARSHALAKQTVVRVLFGVDNNDVVIMSLAYAPGGSPENADSDSMSNTATWAPVFKPVVVRKIRFNNQIAPPGAEMHLLESGSFGTTKRKVSGQNISFSYTLQFSPTGEVTMDKSSSSIQAIQWGMETIGGKPQKAVFRVATLTGRVEVFREENFKDL